MKKISTISLFIFGVVLTSILTAGLVFYQDNKTSKSSLFKAKTVQNVTSSTNTSTTKITPSNKTMTLNMNEISKHNSETDCFMLISGKVYDITSFFGSHPGGNSTMAPTCGTDATNAYMTKDPYATDSTSGRGHSSRAKNMLNDYYIGDLNQTIAL